MNKKIVIVGGTFNPIHNGHILAIQALYDSGYFAEIWLMPSGTPPFKRKEKETKQNRLDMCYLIQNILDYVYVSEIEVLSDKVGYTYETWKILKQKYPEYTFYWLIGDDNVFQIEEWKSSRELLSNIPLALVNRGGFDQIQVENQCKQLEEKYQATFVSIAMPKIEISSTMLRERIVNHKSIIGYTPQCIIDYIIQEQLYGGN